MLPIRDGRTSQSGVAFRCVGAEAVDGCRGKPQALNALPWASGQFKRNLGISGLKVEHQR